MSKTSSKLLVATAAILALGAVASSAAAGQISLTPGSVIGATPYYGEDSNPPLQFRAGNIFDQQTGAVTDITIPYYNYWLSADYRGITSPFITVDLGAEYTVGSFELFNTHNDGAGDRGTGNFAIYGSDSLANDPTFNTATLGGTPTLLLNAALAYAPVADPITGQDFNAVAGPAVRYIQFRPLSAACQQQLNPDFGGHCHTDLAFGLNELRVFGDAAPTGSPAPEPAAWALMLTGFGLAGATLRRRRVSPA